MLEKQQTVLPLERIQAIRIRENPLRELLGFATVFIVGAGGNHHDKYSRNMMLISLVENNSISAILKEIIEDYHYVYSLKRPPIRAVNNYILKEWIKGSPIIIISLAVNWKMGLLAVLLLLVYGAGLGYLRFQAAGWRIDDAQLTLRYRWFLKHTLIMKKHKIQFMEMRQNWFQKRKRLGSLYSTIVSGGMEKKGKALNLDKDDIATIYQWFQSTHFTKPNET